MVGLVVAIALTLGVSAFCSLLEAMLLSVTTAEIESLKQKSRRRGNLMEKFKKEIELTNSAILSLNTIANTLGAALVGGLSLKIFGEDKLIYFSIGMTVGILLFSEILPKNVAVLYRKSLMRHFVFGLYGVRLIMGPIAAFCKGLVSFLFKAPKDTEDPNNEIILLAEKGAKEGRLTQDERDMVANALRLDDVLASTMMTPRTVVMALNKSMTLKEVHDAYEEIQFGRIPIYNQNIDDIVGIVRRRDILASEDESSTLESLMQSIIFIPENASGVDALQHLLKNHQQLAVVVDEFGSMSGVLTLEDIFEELIGKEIFEQDDVAVDMRALARKKSSQKNKPKKEKKDQ